MTRIELVDEMVKGSGLKKKDAEAALRAFTNVVGSALKNGDNVSLVGFGSFKSVKREARTGVNPATRKKIKIPAKQAPVFSAGKVLKDMVNS